MAEPPKAPSARPRGRAELLARREARRRQLRHRRRRAAAGLALVVAAAAAIPLLTGGSPDRDRDLSSRAKQNATSAGENAGERAALAVSTPARNSSPQPDWERHTGPVPILEWHVIGDPGPGSSYPELYVSRDDFRAQIEWLGQEGYEAVTLAQVEDAWWDGGKLPPKPVVLSFDDGYRPHFTYALPLLHERGWAGVLNLKAEGSGLYRSNVEAMIDAGWEIASHTVDHLDLTSLDAEGLHRELDESREMLQDEYGVRVRNFCYPAGRYDQKVIDAVEAAGYEGATTQTREYARREAPYELGRFSILRSTGTAGLAGALASS